jgi:predicted molibdopterin-dependent oxidoreductase YjgC
VFLPFHYGYWDTDTARHDRAANELTATRWDPASKQPLFKLTAVRVHKIDEEGAQ